MQRDQYQWVGTHNQLLQRRESRCKQRNRPYFITGNIERSQLRPIPSQTPSIITQNPFKKKGDPLLRVRGKCSQVVEGKPHVFKVAHGAKHIGQAS